MLDHSEVNSLIDDIQFELDLPNNKIIGAEKRYSPADLKEWRDDIHKYHDIAVCTNKDLTAALDKLAQLIAKHEEKPVPVIDKADIKRVFFMLKEGRLLPKTMVVNGDCTRLVDSELVDAPQEQVFTEASRSGTDWIAAANNRKFIEKIIAKYKPDNMVELISLFKQTQNKNVAG